jgi:hypothetical protein
MKWPTAWGLAVSKSVSFVLPCRSCFGYGLRMISHAPDMDNLLRILQDARTWFRNQIRETPTGTLPTWVVDADEAIGKKYRNG